MPVELKPFRIGDVEVKFPVTLAALAGYSDLAYRLICRTHGAPFCTTEVMLAPSVMVAGKLRKRLLASDEADHPVGGQIMGASPEKMAAAAVILSQNGFDVIDLNFACPVRKAVRRGRGGHLMREPELAVAITRAVVDAVERPVMLKLRRSFDQVDPTNEAFWRIAEAAFDCGAAALCVHGRSVEAKYAGPADWAFLASVKDAFPDRTIIGSGDVLTPLDALRMLEQTGVDAVAAARGALGNPWFFRQVGDLAAGREPYIPPLPEQRHWLEKHFAHACELYGPRRGPRMMRKFGIKYARLHPHPKPVRAAFIAVKCPDDWQRVLDECYADD